MIRLISIAIAGGILAACAGAPRMPAPQPQASPAPPAQPGAKTAPYEVFGQRYYPLTDATGYRERGVASWYGGKFHGRKTANGERYDMYEYTAAHTTLPLPTWVKVTNLRNGSSVTVRVNDRGPFVKNRLIDLSYAAALQLDMIDDGTTLVEVEAMPPAAGGAIVAVPPAAPAEPAAAAPEPAVAVASAGAKTPGGEAARDDDTGVDRSAARAPAIYVQVGAFGEHQNAQRLQDRLYNAGFGEVRLESGYLAGIPVHRVQVGPVSGVLEYDQLIAQLESIGISDTHLVTD